MMTTTVRSQIDPVPTTGRLDPVPATGQLDLDGLELLPCGCVVAIQSARPHPVRVISLEAKGPHCPLAWHRSGSVLTMGNPFDPAEDLSDEEAAFSAAP